MMNIVNDTIPEILGSFNLYGRFKRPCVELGQPEKWWIFLLSSALCPVAFIFILLLVLTFKRLIIRLYRKFFIKDAGENVGKTAPAMHDNAPKKRLLLCGLSPHGFHAFRLRMQELVSAKFVSGEMSVFLMFLASQVSFLIYLTEVSVRQSCCLEKCYVRSLFDDAGAILDLLLNCLFGIHFLIRFIAAHKKLPFLFELYSVIDYFTVPPAIVGLLLNRSWTGLRFLRVLYFLNIPDILQYLRILRTRTALRLTQLVCSVVSALLMSAGMFHLLENSGDPFYGLAGNKQNLSYWEFVYFCVVTASTVGYGDIVCYTVFGRIFNAIFIMSTLAVVASVIPDIFRIISNRKKYAGHYESPSGKKHIIVCGNVNFLTALGFLKEFLHKDRGITDIKVLFMDLKEPDMEMETLLKRYFTEVEYFQGSAMKSQDLFRVRADTSDAVIIVGNKQCIDPDAEDAANIMRVISIKNFHSSIRVIVELMQYHNKAYLLNIPSWNWKNGDEVVCLAELKLGLIAQSCIAPGFSTLMANLFTSRSFTSLEKQSWRTEYLRGTGLEMYSENLSSSFTNMTFAQISEICLVRLDIMLIAISLWSAEEDDFMFVINPRPETVITANAQGFFIADSAEDVQRAAVYCNTCHAHVERITSVKKCDCKSAAANHQTAENWAFPAVFADNPSRRISMIRPAHRKDSKTKQEKVEIFIQNYPSTPRLKRSLELLESKNIHPAGAYLVVPLYKNPNSASESSCESDPVALDGDTEHEGSDAENLDAKFDSTGMFHWCAPRPFESALLDRHAAAKRAFKNHVVVGIFADAHSPLIGLNSLVMPLRSSNFRYEDLREVVILGNVEYLKREWKNLYNFPKVTLIKGTALSRADLRAISIHSCSMCVVLTSKIPNYNDATLTDKEVIMASLNIKAMDFEPRRIRRNSRQPSTSVSGPESLKITKALTHQSSTARRKMRPGARIPMITDLFNDPNVQFLDPDDEDNDDYDTGFFATEPFACGTAFTASVLDSLMSMVYFNPCAFRVIRALIFGGASSELEEILAEGAGLIGGPKLSDDDNRNRSFVSQTRMADFPFSAFINATFGELFVSLIQKHGLLCLGLFRLMPASSEEAANLTKRYVITKPLPNDVLRESDYLFVLMQSDYAASHNVKQNVTSG
ncbi:calcium-activated potassium channel subunit alpha-1-like [Paramacrobiotus metropolitanus]|uniref:calcium-activated potassium channel subunit alpha-1-like n=1 Tax=Paramacrobiotus metropolitanus TaxID=2943436 RepID=UPI0024456B06|nr:calcium-activated potassium channel subunit alpha-1-like [Paramacrobiotus metropolitanus]